jgi:hypothetical protein
MRDETLPKYVKMRQRFVTVVNDYCRPDMVRGSILLAKPGHGCGCSLKGGLGYLIVGF